MRKEYFENKTPTKYDILFYANNKVEDEFAAVVPYSPSELENLERQHGHEHRSMHSNLYHVQA